MFEILANVVETVLNLYTLLHVVAILFTWIDADPNNIFVKKINDFTFPMWRYMEKILPSRWRNLSALVSILVLYWLTLVLPAIIVFTGSFIAGRYALNGYTFQIFKTLIYATLKLGDSILTFFMILCVVWFIISIAASPVNNPIVRSIFLIVDPVITIFQKILPRTKIDFSPLVAAFVCFLGFYVLKQLGDLLVLIASKLLF